MSTARSALQCGQYRTLICNFLQHRRERVSEEKLAGTQLTMYDDAGNPETVELSRYKGDNVRALARVHLSEALLASGDETSTDEHSHQWMDENGWTYRTVYLQDQAGNIYAATMNIANGKNRRILYNISNIRKIDTKKLLTALCPQPELEGTRS